MRIMCLSKGYASYGASIHTSAAEHLERVLKDIEPVDLKIEVTAFVPHEGPAKPTLESLLDQHILKFPHQVRARYRVKAGKLLIDYPSALRDAESFGSGGIYAVAHNLPRALEELSAAVVGGLRAKPPIWKLIDALQLAAAIEKSKASLPANPDELADYMREQAEERRASATVAVSIDDLDIEWEQYHPSAKTILDAPFFWSEVDDDAPHGNDTGADLLAAFKRWQKRNPDKSYVGYVDRLLSRWGFSPDKAGGPIDEDQMSWIRQEAEIALAFAAIKLRGHCDEGETRVAISALDQRIERLGNAPERARKLILLREKLQNQ